MGWSNDQATSLNGQAFTYTNTTVNYSANSALALTGSSETLSGSSLALSSSSSLTLDATSDIKVNGSSLPRGLVARNLLQVDSPVGGTTASTFDTAATVLTCTLATAYRGRIYLVSCPGLQVRMNVAARTGVQITFTQDGTTPTVPNSGTGLALGSQFVNCPTAGSPVPCNFGMTYVRSVANDGPLKLNLSIWNVSGGGATVANANGASNYEPIELLVFDMGADPGTSP